MALVWQMTIVVFPKKTHVSGVILEGDGDAAKTSSSSLKSAFDIARSYFRKPCAGSDLTVQWAGERFSIKTDQSGHFTLETDLPYDDNMDLVLYKDEKSLTYDEKILHTHFFDREGLLVISDIDDTILISHTNTRLKRLLTTLFRPFDQRKPVVSTSRIFDSMGRKTIDCAYVSRSEYNLFPLLKNFMAHNDLPGGPLFLTPFLSFGELISNKKDPGFKVKTIDFLLERSSHESVILMGDDTQHDLAVYAEISRKHKSRIKQVYIRQTDPNVDKSDSKWWEALKANAEKVVYFNDATTITSDTP